jgi:hypothetical protein
VRFAGTLESKKIRQTAGLEHVTNGRIAVGNQFGWRFGLYRRSRPERKQLPGQQVQGPENESCNIHDG